VLSWWPILLFWPAVALSILVAALGLAQKRVSRLLISAILVSPASLYLAATPRLRFLGLLPIAAYLAAAAAMRRGHTQIGWMLVAVTATFFIWLAFTVFTSDAVG
jgi:hypothetical protein